MLDEQLAKENHEEKLKEIANGFQADDAKIVLDIFVKKYPTLVFRSLHERFQEMTKNGENIKDTLNQIYGVYGIGGNYD